MNPGPQTPPSTDEVRQVLQDAGLPLAKAEDLGYLADGWEQWAFLAGDTVIRLPKESNPDDLEKLQREGRISRAIAPHLPLPISVLDVHEKPSGTVFST